jgi:putative flippase GtrA
LKKFWGSDHIFAQAVRFGIVGGTGYVLFLAWYWGALELGTSEIVAVATAPFANIVYNFFLHRGWTFRRRDNGQSTDTP